MAMLGDRPPNRNPKASGVVTPRSKADKLPQKKIAPRVSIYGLSNILMRAV